MIQLPYGDQDLRVLEPVVEILGAPWQIDDWGHCNYVITRYDNLEGLHFGATVLSDGTALKWNAGLDGIGSFHGPVVANSTPATAAAWVLETFLRISQS